MTLTITYPDGTDERIAVSYHPVLAIGLLEDEPSARCPQRADYFEMAINDGTATGGYVTEFDSGKLLFTWSLK